jgi:hypothetical protein
LCLFSLPIAISTSKALGSGTSGSDVRISVCLKSLTDPRDYPFGAGAFFLFLHTLYLKCE